MTGDPEPIRPPLRASDRLVESVLYSTDGTTYSRRIRINLECMGLRLTKDTPRSSVRRVIDETLRTPCVKVLQELRDTVTNEVPNVDILVDPVTRDFIESRGNSVAGVLMAYRLAQDAELEAGDIEDPVEVEMRRISGIVHVEIGVALGQGVSWRAGRVIVPDGIPDTYGATMIGRRLNEVITHPLLDRHGMTIVDWDGRAIAVETDQDALPVLAQTRTGRSRRR